jgi:hypothetical protein
MTLCKEQLKEDICIEMNNQEIQKLKRIFSKLSLILAVLLATCMVLFISIYMIYEIFGTRIFVKMNAVWLISYSQTSAYICGIITAISIALYYLLNRE